MSLARASRSRVSKNDEEQVEQFHISLACHDGYPRAASAACLGRSPKVSCGRKISDRVVQSAIERKQLYAIGNDVPTDVTTATYITGVDYLASSTMM